MSTIISETDECMAITFIKPIVAWLLNHPHGA